MLAREEILDARVRRKFEHGVAISLRTPIETGSVFDLGRSQADSWHGPYYIVVRPGVVLGGEVGR